MDIKKVAVLGAGAVGSYVIWGLSARRDIELGVVADGPRGERLRKDGCAINGKIYRPAVWTPQEAHDADLRSEEHTSREIKVGSKICSEKNYNI